MLRNDLPVEEHVKGVTDLAIEADFLQVLQHPNVIAMRAMANTDPRENRFFIILDRLSTTLEAKVSMWRIQADQASGAFWMPGFGYCCAKTPALHSLWKERLTTARDISRALQYLHSQNIVYRDLKPDNVGFDRSTGTVKLFDFGLAKRLDNVQRDGQNGSNLYLLTGNTGSLRYMAPEVALDQPYDQSVDAFSFGILFWQLCTLQTPFAGYTPKRHSDQVVRGGSRPKTERSWPQSWIDLMTSCWSATIEERPTMGTIVMRLDDCLQLVLDEEDSLPSRASEIRAQKRKKKTKDDRLDGDTRLTTEMDGTVKKTDAEIV